VLNKTKDIVDKLRTSKVLENYSYMTTLQVASALIGFIIYPIVIRRVGVEQYGLYAFMLSVVLYFQVVVDFGFDYPAIKDVAFHRDDKERLSEIVSAVLCAKSLLWLAMALVAGVVVWLIPMLRTHWVLFAVLFGQNLVNVLLPQWYFQGMKQMKIPTIINLSCRIMQIPLVVCLVHDTHDIEVYAAIITATMLLGAMAGLVCVLAGGIRLQRATFQQMRHYFHVGWPFFLTDVAASLKERVLTNLIGVYLGMREVAIYDLATKVVQIPRLITQGVNRALFPEVVTRATSELVKKIIRYERIIGLAMIGVVALLGYWVIWFLGGEQMLAAYPLAVVLSTSIYTWLIVGAYLQFVFIPANHYTWVTWNQVVAMVTSLLVCGVGLMLYPHVSVAVGAIVLSGFAELVFCKWMYNKHLKIG